KEGTGRAKPNGLSEVTEKGKNEAGDHRPPGQIPGNVGWGGMKKGKDGFWQKAEAHTVFEARRLGQMAHETKVATQVAVGNQASEATRLLCEWIWAGAIGPVREVHNWSTRPFWPQGIERPANEEKVPEGLNWDLWLGPAPL